MLAFSVVILCLLAMLGMMFLVTMRLASRASLNALGPLQADLAAQAGLNHAQAILRQAYAQQIIGSPATVTQQSITVQDGVFSQISPYRYTGGDPDTQGPAYSSVFRQFAGTGNAVLFGDSSAPPNELRYTNAPLRVSPLANAGFLGTPPQPQILPDQAWRWETQGSTNDLYPNPTQPNLKTLLRQGSYRGNYCVWIDDLDGKLHVEPRMWGIDTANLPVVTLSTTVQTGILTYLNEFLKIQLLGSDLANDLNYIVTPPTTTPSLLPYVSISDFALNMPSLITLAGSDPTKYENLRSTVGYYFKAGCLNEFDTQGNPISFPGALNINTAPVEVIAAALSQIPAYDPALEDPNAQPTVPPLMFGTKKTDALDPQTSLAFRLALRIVAKRPFMCRMDFEDFAAAHLPGDLTGTNAASTPLGAINFAILKRGSDPTQPTSQIELSLQQYLEMAGNSQDPISYASYAPFLTPARMQERFAFFANDTGVNLTVYPNASHDKTRLTVKEFNNLLNSVSRAFHAQTGAAIPQLLSALDDRQITAPGERGIIVIHPGANGVLDIPVASLGLGDIRAQIIVAGPSKILQTRRVVAPDQLVVEAIAPCISAGQDGGLQTTPVPPDTLDPNNLFIIIAGSDPTAGGIPVLHTTPAQGSDDVILTSIAYIVPGGANRALATAAAAGDLPVEAVLTAPSGTADPNGVMTGIAATSIFGFSYYSHDTATQDYMPARVNNPNLPANPDLPQYVGKFVYRNQVAEKFSTSDPSKTDNTSICNYVIGDLVRWSCIGTGYRSGYYDMFFNAGDIMHMFLGEVYDPQPPPGPSEPQPDQRVCVESEGGSKKLHTGWGPVGADDDIYGTAPANDDVQETPVGDPADAETVVISAGPDGALQTQPTAPDVVVDALFVTDLFNFPGEQFDDAFALVGENLDMYILPGPNNVLDTPVDTTVKKVQVIVGGGGYLAGGGLVTGGTAMSSIPTKEVIQIAANKTNNTSVWGPVRASQRPGLSPDPNAPVANDQKAPPRQGTTDPAGGIILNLDQIPGAVIQPGAVLLAGALSDGDVAWSPQFTFRSRFFGIYVLGCGAARSWLAPERDPPGIAQGTQEQTALRDSNLKRVGERRLEAVYDAFKDEIIWQRSPATEKRSLADP